MYVFKPYAFTENNNNNNNDNIENPIGRVCPIINCNDKYLYSYCGSSGHGGIESSNSLLENDEIWKQNRPYFRELWKYNLSTQQWQRFNNQLQLPTKKIIIFATYFTHDKLILCGNKNLSNNNDNENYDDNNNNYPMYICDLITGDIDEYNTTGSVPQLDYHQNFIRDNNYLYTLGSGYFFDVHRIEITTRKWECVYRCCRKNLLNDPPVRIGLTSIIDDKKIYIFGGITDFDLEPPLREITVFDIKLNCWNILQTIGDDDNTPSFPTDRSCSSVAHYKNYKNGESSVILSGGGKTNKLLDDIWELNLKTLQWNCLSKFNAVLPRPVSNHSMSVTPSGKLYSFGGYVRDSEKKLWC
ncbi:kelch domain-containing protein 10 homolog isoform X2 [Microplitis demolitor]|uniref:kelch domain-containing protein 10 homolog isoform X2 n=2 Tax=Microplitis demolitor TaxID=69319 RepID=UPI00235B614D|nr:kelch domain-containing protein 10 homolog isoform X2 [Microplitis demolitor]